MLTLIIIVVIARNEEVVFFKKTGHGTTDAGAHPQADQDGNGYSNKTEFLLARLLQKRSVLSGNHRSYLLSIGSQRKRRLRITKIQSPSEAYCSHLRPVDRSFLSDVFVAVTEFTALPLRQNNATWNVIENCILAERDLLEIYLPIAFILFKNKSYWFNTEKYIVVCPKQENVASIFVPG